LRWSIGLTLYPDRSYIEAEVVLSNPTPIAHSILYWANVSVHTNEDYQIIFPPSVQFATFHGKNEFARWPVADGSYRGIDYAGKDLSLSRNHPSPTSFFAWDCREDFVAGYDHGKDAGVVHVADHHVVPGKKFWTWGTGAPGQRWEKLLTEKDGPYIEIMVGGFSDNQPDYSWITPFEVKRFTQRWYPIRDIGGVKAANERAAVNLEESRPQAVKIGIQTTAVQSGARLVLTGGGDVILNEWVDLSPDKPYIRDQILIRTLKLPDLRLVLYTTDGEEIISYSPPRLEEKSMPSPVEPPKPLNAVQPPEEFYLTGLRLELFHHPSLDPMPYYEQALLKDNGFSAAHLALGRLYLKAGRFEEAAAACRRALDRPTAQYIHPQSGESYYYLGLALRFLGKENAAKEAFGRSLWDSAWNSASYLALAELACREEEYTKAIATVDKALVLNTRNPKALHLKSALLRKTGHYDQAGQLNKKAMEADPLNFAFVYENNLLFFEHDAGIRRRGDAVIFTLEHSASQKMDGKEPAWGEFERLMRNEKQNYLELAVTYGNWGLYGEAVDVIHRYLSQNKDAGTVDPMIYYYTAFFLNARQKADSDGPESAPERGLRHYLDLAAASSLDYSFPFRLESLDVLSWAVKEHPEDSHAFYLLGNLLFEKQPKKAKQYWQEAVRLQPDLWPALRNLSIADIRTGLYLKQAFFALDKALRLHTGEARLYYEWDILAEVVGLSPAERLQMLRPHHSVLQKRDDALTREILLLIQLGDYDTAIGILDEHHFHVWEGGGHIHNVYVDAYLLIGLERMDKGDYFGALDSFKKALEYPENLEVARPEHGGRAPQIYYLMGLAEEKLGQKALAVEHFKKALDRKVSDSSLNYYQGMALKAVGRTRDAEHMFEGLVAAAQQRLNADSPDYFA
ncbi:MAG: DUF5107 domain-containing protein, partial [Candidatus Aminicenantes bacterium]|nr:DUF5107 domain-containing protein [Candidatus Aminicenantes bacterium]